MVRGAQRRRGLGAPQCGSRRRTVLARSLSTAPRPRAQAEVGRQGASRDGEAPLSGPARRRSRRGLLGDPELVADTFKQPGYAESAGRRSPERSGGRAGLEGSPPPSLPPRGTERRQKKGREPGSAERAPRSALSAARAPSPAPHAPARAPRPPAPLSTPAPHTSAQSAGQTTGTPTPTAPPPRGASC